MLARALEHNGTTHRLPIFRFVSLQGDNLCPRDALESFTKNVLGFLPTAQPGADIVGALSCCSGCQLFVEGRRRHPRRGSFGCVSTALEKTTVFCGTGFFSYAISRLSCVVPSASGAPCLRHRFHMLACGVFDIFYRPPILQM